MQKQYQACPYKSEQKIQKVPSTPFAQICRKTMWSSIYFLCRCIGFISITMYTWKVTFRLHEKISDLARTMWCYTSLDIQGVPIVFCVEMTLCQDRDNHLSMMFFLMSKEPSFHPYKYLRQTGFQGVISIGFRCRRSEGCLQLPQSLFCTFCACIQSSSTWFLVCRYDLLKMQHLEQYLLLWRGYKVTRKLGKLSHLDHGLGQILWQGLRFCERDHLWLDIHASENKWPCRPGQPNYH